MEGVVNIDVADEDHEAEETPGVGNEAEFQNMGT
jgi:hypothetical protein